MNWNSLPNKMSGELECEYCESDTDELIECERCGSMFCYSCIGIYIFYCPFCMNYWAMKSDIKKEIYKDF
jgi:hypothetical protein